MSTSRAYNPRYVPPAHRPMRAPGACAWPGCEVEANYPAPRSRGNLRDYVHFCLDHVRAYNAGWNFFAGMSGDEIDAFRHEDLTGHRPTWRMAARPTADVLRRAARDPFGFMRGEANANGHNAPLDERPNDEERGALGTLGFERPVPLAELKSRFKALVKVHHPDANGGDEESGERLRLIIHAYRFLLGKVRDRVG